MQYYYCFELYSQFFLSGWSSSQQEQATDIILMTSSELVNIEPCPKRGIGELPKATGHSSMFGPACYTCRASSGSYGCLSSNNLFFYIA